MAIERRVCRSSNVYVYLGTLTCYTYQCTYVGATGTTYLRTYIGRLAGIHFIPWHVPPLSGTLSRSNEHCAERSIHHITADKRANAPATAAAARWRRSFILGPSRDVAVQESTISTESVTTSPSKLPPATTIWSPIRPATWAALSLIRHPTTEALASRLYGSIERIVEVMIKSTYPPMRRIVPENS